MHNYSWADDCRVYITRSVRITPLQINLEGTFPSAVALHSPRSHGVMVMSSGSDFLAPLPVCCVTLVKTLTFSESEIFFLWIGHTRVVVAHLSSVKAYACQISTNLICQACRKQSCRCTQVEGFGFMCLRWWVRAVIQALGHCQHLPFCKTVIALQNESTASLYDMLGFSEFQICFSLEVLAQVCLNFCLKSWKLKVEYFWELSKILSSVA